MVRRFVWVAIFAVAFIVFMLFLRYIISEQPAPDVPATALHAPSLDYNA